MRPFPVLAAVATVFALEQASAEPKKLPEDVQFCPSWAEAHERTLAGLNGGRPPYPVQWKGCIRLKRGARVDVVDQDEESTEIIVKGKHWFADEQVF